MTLPEVIREKAEAASLVKGSKSFFGDWLVDVTSPEFIRGVEWLWQHLSENANEFDGQAAIDAASERGRIFHEAMNWQDGAKWQYDQCKQRVALAETYLQRMQEYSTTIADLTEKLTATEAKLNRIAMLGMGATAYTKEYTEEVNKIVREHE